MNKKRLLRQLMLASMLFVGLTILVSPGKQAQAATSPPSATQSQVRPNNIILGTTLSGINAVACNRGNSDIFYAYLGTDGHLNIADQYIDPNSGYAINTVTYTDTSGANPDITCWNGRLWVVFTGGNGLIHVGDATDATCSFGSNCVLASGNIIPGQSTNEQPAIAANGGTLYVAWKGTNNNSMTVEESVSGTYWFDHTVISGNATSAEPSLTSNNGSLIIAWAGTDRPAHINFATYHDGNANLTNKVVGSDTTQSIGGQTAIGVNTNSGRLLFAFIGSDNTFQIVTASWASNTGYRSNGRLAGAYTDNPPGLAPSPTNPQGPSLPFSVYFTGTNSQINAVQMPG
jgi:hypothetical protein